MTTIKRKRRHKPGWYVIVTILLVVALYVCYNTSLNIMKIWRLTNMKRQEQRILKESLRKLETLRHERERLLNDSTYIEEIARREYGMVRKGDEVFHISLPDSKETRKKDAR